jgi:hypothetical protein
MTFSHRYPFVLSVACASQRNRSTDQPEPELRLLLDALKLQLPAQPPPRITTEQARSATAL